MIRLFLWFCTLLGFIVVWIVGAFLTQKFWLIPLVNNRIAPFGVEFKAQEIQWLPAWPLRVKGRQIVVSYLDGKEPRDLLRGPDLSVEMEGVPWSSGAWQIRRVEASFDEISWSAHRVRSPNRSSEGDERREDPVKGSPSSAQNKPNQFSLLEYQFQLTKMVVYSSKVGVAPATYVLNLKTPVVRGPFTQWGELYKAVLPGQIQLNR